MTAVSQDRILGANTGLAVKAPVVAVATANVPLSGLLPIPTMGGGSYVPQVGDRILCVAQADATTNGIYQAQTSAWQRTADFSNNNDIVQGTLVTVFGANQPVYFYQLTTPNQVVIGTSPLTFVPQGALAVIPGAAIVTGNLVGLRATAPTTGSPLFAIVMGAAAPGDGGGGMYYYNAADLASADNGGTIIVSADGGRWYLGFAFR